MTKSFRNPKYLDRYEDVVFDLEQALDIDPANASYQNRDGLRFIADNTGETTPFDWYNARLSVDFKVNKLADATALTATDHNGIVNGSNSFIKKLTITANGREVYSCNYANHCVNIKNLLEYNPSYAKSIGTNEFYFLDTTKNAEETEFTINNTNVTGGADVVKGRVANYNKGFAARKALLGLSTKVNCEIPLNRYSFFEALEDKLLPHTKTELNVEFDDDKNLIWRQGGADGADNNYRLIILRLQLFVPRLTFNAEGQKLYMENYLNQYKWTYLNENVERSNNSKQKTGHSRITNGISKPRHVFVFMVNTFNIDNQIKNSFLYNTFSVGENHTANPPTNARTLNRCYLEVGNGNEYPDIHYKPNDDLSRVYRDVMSYVYANNGYQGGTLLNIGNFKTLFSFVYFDLTKQKMDIKDGVTQLAFHYELSDNTPQDYNIYALVLHEKNRRNFTTRWKTIAASLINLKIK